MTDIAAPARGGWFGIISSTFTAVVVGFASTILLIMEAARAVGATPSQQASWAAALCFGMGITSLILSWRYKMPMITAWSTPGAALIATSAAGVSYPNALGAFVVSGLLMCVAGLIKPLEKAIEHIPASIASALLAGVLFHYASGVPAAAIAMPLYVIPLIVIYFALRLAIPLFAVPVLVAAGIAMAAFNGAFGSGCCTLGLTHLEWTTPSFDGAAIVSLGIPLFLVTMASQNLPGFAVLRASGYQPPVSPSLLVTGAASVIMAPFGSHSINLAAITATLISGPDCHPDPGKRWLFAWPYLILYGAVGLAAASFVQILGSMPSPLIIAIAGLALFSPLTSGITAMLKVPRDIESALVTFLVTASGVTVPIYLGQIDIGSIHIAPHALGSIGSAFWGLVAGLVLFGARHLLQGPQKS